MKNRTIYARDCLEVLEDSNSIPSESVDLIYLDPPFNSKSTYNLPFKGQYKDTKPVEAFKDTWEWGEVQQEYLNKLERGGAGRSYIGRYRQARQEGLQGETIH